MFFERLIKNSPQRPYAEGLARDKEEDTRQIVSSDGRHIATVAISPSWDTTHYLIHAANMLPDAYNGLQSLMEDIENCEDSLEGLLALRAAAKSQIGRMLLKMENPPCEHAI